MERPILFSTPMVRAILDGRKTQTRRIIKKQPHGAGEWIMQGISWLFPNVNPYINIKCPHGQPGDILWVRETWNVIPLEWKEPGDILGVERRYIRAIDPRSGATIPYFYLYKASSDFYEIDHREWKPSIFMPKEAARIWLEVTNVRVERLKDISDEDCQAEGLTAPMITDHLRGGWYVAYKALWESINGKDSWTKNPWVWCVSFKRI